jgi:hypothetical protein
MATSERLTHLLVLDRTEDREFARRGGGDPKVREVERRVHGQKLRGDLTSAIAAQDVARSPIPDAELEALGVVLTIEASDGFPLRLDALERQSQHRREPRPKWLLLNVSVATEDAPEQATVWVSDEYRASFLQIFEDFLTKETKTGKPRNRALVANMARIRASVLRDLWQSDGEPPTSGRRWWELWLRPGADALALATRFAEAAGLRIAPSRLSFDNRQVMWIEGTWNELLPLPFTAVPIAEIRRPQFIDTIEDLDLEDQADWADDLAGRAVPAGPDAPAVCLLDTGVRRSHALLTDSIDAADVHTVVGQPTGDVVGHGTRMAGLALFGPLDDALLATTGIPLRHRLESVKVLPDPGSPPHDPVAYGVVTAEAVARPEIVADRRRAFCMPITNTADRSGEPSLWSAAIDALAAGTDIGSTSDGIELLGVPDPAAARLFIISAGNVAEPFDADHRQRSTLSPIEDPAQAWNALTVGAHTDLTGTPTDPTYAGWTPMASAGDLSPHSRTGVIAGGSKWPIKPDICMEGGNVLTDGAGDYHGLHPLLSPRTTGHRNDVALASANATSAATAQAARLAALVSATYPAYWPETVRGLITHHAEWTPLMQSEINATQGKRHRRLLLKTFGWGVPEEQAVLTSASNAVTMVVHDEFIPFTGTDFKLRNFRLHQLAWPAQALEDLGGADVELRVTLSYFIEPNAARRGWRSRYAYASHGLRFELRGPNESTADFVRRVNRQATIEEEGGSSAAGPGNWTVGPNQRNQGSLHQDIWQGTGPELAGSGGVLGVHAVGGWWKYNRRKDRVDLPVRYGLIVSLRTKAQEADIYSPIATELAIPAAAIAIEI